MKKNNLITTLTLLLLIVLVSCSNEEIKTESQVSSRLREPILANTVQIGTQEWMTKNLNVTRYRNGDPIPQVTDPFEWFQLTTGAWCYCQNNTANGVKYGKLYNWYAVNDPRGLAPAGYHIPSDLEWTLLTDFLGGTNFSGDKMKATTGWLTSPETTNTNSSGFTALPGGFRDQFGTFGDYNGDGGFWWSSSNAASRAWARKLYFNVPFVYQGHYNKTSGYSVRCVRD